MSKRIVGFISAALGVLAVSGAVWADGAKATAEPLFATVNGKPITQKEFQAAYGSYLRETYYHQQVPQDKLDEARKEVGQRVVDRLLAIEDAKRRGLVADEQAIAKTIAEYESRYAASPMWQKNRDAMLPGLKQQLAEQDLLRQIEAIGHKIEEPAEPAVRAFYDSRKELFTEPEKMRLHTILLKVDPSSPKAMWDAAREEAQRIYARLRAGAKFEELASLHSQDISADKGGDMGYLHRGMLPAPVQVHIEESPLGTVCEPLDVLEGVAIFRLDERVPPKVMAYEQVAGRARELLKREQTKQAWEAFVAELRKTAVVKFVDTAPQPEAKN